MFIAKKISIFVYVIFPEDSLIVTWNQDPQNGSQL